jgi:hypothetical protein
MRGGRIIILRVAAAEWCSTFGPNALDRPSIRM